MPCGLLCLDPAWIPSEVLVGMGFDVISRLLVQSCIKHRRERQLGALLDQSLQRGSLLPRCDPRLGFPHHAFGLVYSFNRPLADLQDMI